MTQSMQITEAERAEFIRRQTVRSGMSFVAKDGLCFKCQGDVIAHHIKKGNDGSTESVTGCPFCLRTFCD
jgi:hypothetical protein